MKTGVAVIVGRPNSGKSTLFNSLVGEHVSIVSDKPQTTRHRILGVLNKGDAQIVFADTPGIHKPAYRMNVRMQQAVQEAMAGVDFLLHVVDASEPFGSGENYVLQMVRVAEIPSVLLLNKIDRMAKPKLLPIMDRYGRESTYTEIIPISALDRTNLDLVIDAVIRRLPEGPPQFEPEQVTDRTERFLSGELIREKILQRTREEIPYATAVLITKFDESDRTSRKLVRIEADIIVEKRSQQGIILGARGGMLKQVGTAARLDLQNMLGCRVYLSLMVRTVTGWRNEEGMLDELGV